MFEREARVKFFVTFEWYYCEWGICESDNGKIVGCYVSDKSEYSE